MSLAPERKQLQSPSLGPRPADSRPRAVVDLGSSSAKILAVDGQGCIVADSKRSTALGAGISSRHRVLPRANQRRARAALEALVEIADRCGVRRADIDIVATAATRNADGRPGVRGMPGAVFLRELRRAFRVGRAVALSGEAEAASGFHGALVGWPDGRVRAALAQWRNSERVRWASWWPPAVRFTLIESGGGSHQVCTGVRGQICHAGSVQLGSLHIDSLLDRCEDGSLCSARLAAADRAVARELDDLAVPRPLVVGSTVVLGGGLARFLRAYLGRDVVTRHDIQNLRGELAALSLKKRAQHICRQLRLNLSAARAAARSRSAVFLLDHGELQRQIAALGLSATEPAYRARKLPAKATLLLRLLELALVGLHQPLLLSGTDRRHLLVGALGQADHGPVNDNTARRGPSAWI